MICGIAFDAGSQQPVREKGQFLLAKVGRGMHAWGSPVWPVRDCLMYRFTLLLLITGCVHVHLNGQTQYAPDHDSSYYASYREKLTARLYLSRKYTALLLYPPYDRTSTLKYRPNTSLNLGLGASFRSLTLNIGFGLNSFNPHLEKGKTRYFDLQSHVYTRAWNLDLLGEFYRGYYLAPKGLGAGDGRSYYLRPDLGLQLTGIAAYRALQPKKFSYQAGLLQNEWQKKSAGSLLAGGDLYYGALQGDSSVIPLLTDPAAAGLHIRKVHFFELGGGLGYGYCLVFKKHLYLLGSATVDLALHIARESDGISAKDRAGLSVNYIFHAGAGWNGPDWDLGLLWVNDDIRIRSGTSHYDYLVRTGNYRLFYATRLKLSRRQKKILAPVNGLLDMTLKIKPGGPSH